MRQMEMEEEVIDLSELLRLLWSHVLQIVAVGLVAAVISFLVCTFALTPRYQASVNMIVNTRQDNTTTVSNDNITSAKNMIDTYAVIIKSNLVLNDVIQRMGLDMTYSQLADSITVGSVNSTQIMAITVTNENPGLAGKIAQTIAEVAPDVIVEKVEAGSCKAVSDVEIGTTPCLSPDQEDHVALRSGRYGSGLRSAGGQPPAAQLHCRRRRCSEEAGPPCFGLYP